MKRQLYKILNDSTSGSVELLLKLTSFITIEVENEDELQEVIDVCKTGVSTFAAIDSFISSLKNDFEHNGFESAKIFSNHYQKKLTEDDADLFKTAFNSIKNLKSVLTISNSKTILELIKKLHEHNPSLTVAILESRPKNEGRIFAKRLLQNKIKVTLTIDSAAALLVKNVDAVFCGADKILIDYSVLNKIGSLQLALLCKEYEKPFYVFCSEGKFTSEKAYRPIEKNSNETWKFTHPNLEINNFYFEVIPKHLITKIFTEKRSIKL